MLGFEELDDFLELEEEMEEEMNLQDIPEEIEEETADLGEDGLSDELQEALLKAPTDRSFREAEMVDIYRHRLYEAQISFATDPDTGEVLRTEEGDLVRCRRNTPGAQVPDGFYMDEEGMIHIREVKDIRDMELLKSSITKQAIERWVAFSDDIDLVFIAAPHYTLAEAEELQRYCTRLGVRLEYQLK